jgi:hypothetical protein
MGSDAASLLPKKLANGSIRYIRCKTSSWC